MTNRKVAFIHTSPAAIGPLMQFYSANAPELEITNLLDDGLLRLLAAKDSATAASRLRNMIQSAVDTYGAELAMITCSSVSKEMADGLATEFALPILKIDYPMARQAVTGGGKIGVAATFPPTLEPTTRLISDAALDAGTTAEIVTKVSPDAYKALLANDTATHDELLLALIEELEAQGVSVIVLAQVSMARVLPLLNGRTSVPVLSSLQTSLEAIRQVLDNT
jgi:Asp/Glu/hydantoin racemase